MTMDFSTDKNNYDRYVGNSVVLVSNQEPLRKRMVFLLQGEGYLVVGESGGAAEAVRMVRRLHPDLIIIDESLNGSNAFDVASIFVQENVPVLYLCKDMDHMVFSKNKNSVYFQVLPKPFDSDTFLMNVTSFIKSTKYIQDLQGKLAYLNNKTMQEENSNRAKEILMVRHSITEAEAHKYIQKESMRQGKPIYRLVQEIIAAENKGKNQTDNT